MSRFTAREAEVLEGILLGKTNKAIGKTLDASDQTVKVHVKALLLKLGAKTRGEAAMMVMRAALMLPCPRCGYIDAGKENGHDEV